MGVSVGSLSYVSTLDNSDFQGKSLQDIQLIRLRLQLTGDDSGIKKYDAAFKAAAAEEAALRKQLNNILEETKVKVAEVAAVQSKPVSKTILSDSVAEAALYNASLNGMAEVTEVAAVSVEDLRIRLAGVQAAIVELNILNEQGTVSTEVYASSIAILTENELRLQNAIQSETASEIIQTENRIASSAALETQIGLIENLKIQLEQLKARKVNIIDPGQLATQNKLIQETEAELKRLNNVGKVGFDAQGVAIKNTTAKIDPFNRAISRATNLSVIAGTVVSRLTRQIIGLGVGLISFAIGAKAIEALFEYIKGLDIFSGRLNQAKQTLLAFNEVMKDANGIAGKQVGTLKQLYDAATDTNKSFKDRLAAAEQLRTSYAAEFQNASALSIVNGKLKKSYDDLTSSIISLARSEAASTKIAAIEGEKLDNQFQIDKNNAIKAQQSLKAYSDYRKQLENQSAASLAASARGDVSYKTSGGSFLTPLGTLKETLRQIKEQTDFSNLKPSQNNAILSSTEKFLERYVTSVSNGADKLKEANKLLGDNLENFNSLLAGVTNKDQLDNIQSALNIKLKSLVPSDKQFVEIQNKLKQLEAIEKKYSPKISDGQADANAEKQSLKERLELLTKVSEALTTVRRKGLSDDQQALTEVSDRFSSLKAEIEKFNANPKNKNNIIGKNVFNEIDKSQDAAINNQANLNENNYIQADIEKKKKLYNDYEEYRLKVGSTIAESEYKDLLLSGASFKDYLNNQKAAIDSSDLSGAIQERNDLIVKSSKENAEEEKKRYQEILSTNQTYQTTLLIAEDIYQNARKKLVAGGKDKEAAELDLAYKQQKEQLQSSQVDKLRYIQNYNDNVFQLTKKEAEAQLKVLEEIRKGNNLSDPQNDQLDKAISNLKSSLSGINGLSAKYKADLLIQKKQLQDQLKLLTQGSAEWKKIFDEITGVQTKLDDINSDKLKGFAGYAQLASQSFSELSSATENLSPSLSEALSALSKMADVAANAANSIASFGSGDIVGGITGAVGAISGILSLFGSSKQDAEQRAYQQDKQIKQTEAINKALERQISLNEKLYGTQRLTGYVQSLKDIKAAQDAANASLNGKLTLSGIKSFDEQIAKLNNGEKINEFAFGNILKGLKAQGAIFDLTGQSLEQLNVLLDQDKLDEKTAAIVTQLLSLKDQYTDTFNAIRAETIGSTFESQLDNIVSLFENATTTAEDFAANFQKIIQQSIINSFKRQFLETQLQGFYDQFAAFTDPKSGGALDASEISQLQALYNQIIEKAKLNFDQLSQATGVTFGDNPDNENSLKGSIKASLTEETGTILAGTLKGIQLGVNETNLILKSQNLSYGQMMLIAQETLDVAIKIEVNTKRTADNSDNLPNMLLELKGINSNSSNSLDILARASGI